MGIFSDILLTADYDRTLTAPDSTIPQRNIEAIRYFMERGGVFTVNTGRSVPMYRSMRDKVPVNAPVLLYNGSAACDPETEQLSLLRPIDLPMRETIEELLEQFPHLHVEVQGVQAHYNFRPNPGWNAFNAHNGCRCATISPAELPEPFLKFSLYGRFRDVTVADLFRATPEELQEMDEAQRWLEQRFAGKIQAFRAAPRIIDVHAAGVSKNAAARSLQRQLGRKILICVGDADNDLPMLEGADFAFCPADGAVADRFDNVCPCGEGAVADVIYKKIPEILDLRLDNQG